MAHKFFLPPWNEMPLDSERDGVDREVIGYIASHASRGNEMPGWEDDPDKWASLVRHVVMACNDMETSGFGRPQSCEIGHESGDSTTIKVHWAFGGLIELSMDFWNMDNVQVETALRCYDNVNSLRAVAVYDVAKLLKTIMLWRN